ncbi:MAG TPA: hypothetical protein ENI23_11185 [bacterium]|nr:hypothetical protein [bacterium]
MPKSIGRDIKIGVGKETIRGTATPSAYWIPRMSFDFDDKRIVIQDQQGYGVIEDAVAGRVVSKWAEGSLGGIVRAKAIGLFLLNALGQVNTSADDPEAGVNTHTFTVLSSHQHPALTINVDDPNEGDVAYPLGMLNSLELVAEVNEYVKFTADFMAKTGESATVTAVYVSEANFASHDVTVKFADVTAELDTASAVSVKSASILIEKEVEKDDVLGNVNPEDFLNKIIRVAVTITKAYENTTYKALFQSGTAQALRVSMSDTATVIGAATSPQLYFDLNQVQIVEWVVDKGLDAMMIETITLKAQFKIADSKMLEAVLVNTASGY